MMQNMKYAYKQAPWRKQLSAAAWILAALVVFVLIAIAYLNISAKTYAAGIDIQVLRGQQETLIYRIADLRDQLGGATSFETMSRKANESGFNMINDPSRIVYLSVPGYQEPPLEIETYKRDSTQERPILKPSYTRSLWDLFMDGALKLGKSS